MRILATLFFLYIFVSDFYAQKWGANTFSQFTNEALDVEIDVSGNSYITGYVTGETAFNTSNVIQNAAGNGDIYVAKYNSSGDLVWYKKFGGNYSDRAYDLAIGPDQNIVVTGQFFGSVTFGSTTLQSASNSKDIFLFKLDPNGNVIWALKEGGDLAENAYGVTVDHQNNVILTGQFQGNATIAGSNFSSIIDPITNLPSFDLFVSKYDPSGNSLWVRVGAAEKEDRGLAVAVDSQNNIFVTGQYSDTIEFAGNTYNNNGYNIGFVTKISPSGQVQFFNNLKAGFVLPNDIEVNTLNQPIVTGDFSGSMNYYHNNIPYSIQSLYSKKIFVLKIENDGSYQWNYTLGSESDISATSISIDPSKNIFITGYFNCALNQLHDTVTAFWNSVGFKDPYILKISNQGNFVYAKQLGSQKDDIGHGIAVKANDKPILCGSFTKKIYVSNTLSTTTVISNYLSYYELNDFYGNSGFDNYFYLYGDDSPNSFILKYIDDNYEDYNFFKEHPTDSLDGYLNNSYYTTNHFCNNTVLWYETMNYDSVGPLYTYIWNNNSIDSNLVVSNTGNYYLTIQREDGCAANSDSIYVIKDPNPTFPLLSDDIVQLVNQAPSMISSQLSYGFIEFCSNDSVNLYFSNVLPGTSIQITPPDEVPIAVTGSYHINQTGEYYITIYNGSCSRTARLDCYIHSYFPADTMDLELTTSNYIQNDTIKVCEGDNLFFYAYDSLINPNGNFIPINHPYVSMQFFFNNNLVINGSNLHYLTFAAYTSGWYNIKFKFIAGLNNICGNNTAIYEVERMFYVLVTPPPVFNGLIVGENVMCPIGGHYLSVSETHPNFSWSGQGIIWQSTDHDSIQIIAPGNYHYGGLLVDSITGCTNNVNLIKYIQFKPSPIINVFPSDGVICPNDSALLTIANIYQSYNWVGPLGDTLSTINSCYGSDQGLYYCIIVDNVGCSLNSNTINLNEFSIPSISITPTNFICDDEYITISVSYTGNPNFLWEPILSDEDEIYVNQPGVYALNYHQCGIDLYEEIIIEDASIDPLIISSSNILCYGNEVVITGMEENSNYDWSNGSTSTGSLVVYDPGTYFATITNNYGCTATSNIITVTFDSLSVVPFVSDTTICSGGLLSLHDTLFHVINWYTIDTLFLATSNQFEILGLTNDTSFIYSQSSQSCELTFQTININVIDSIPNLEILGDSILCPNESTVLTIQATDTISWFVSNVFTTNSNQISLNQTELQDTTIIFVSVYNQCFTSSFYDTIYSVLPLEITFQDDTVILCYNEIVPYGIEQEVYSMTWFGTFGNYDGEELILTPDFSDGLIYCTAIDLNNCSTDTISLFLLNSHFEFNIVSNFEAPCENNQGYINVISYSDNLSWNTPIGTLDTSFIPIILNQNYAGIYNLTIWDSNFCQYDTSLLITFNPLPIFNLDSDTLLCLNDFYNYAFPSDTNFYSWSFYGSENEIPVNGNQELILTATSPAGCIFVDTIYVMSVNCDDALPNVITSNGDGTNDYFYIDEALIFPNNHLYLFNRWGEKIFDQEGYQNNFEGSRFSEGVYWYVFYQDPINNPKKVKQGFLHIYH